MSKWEHEHDVATGVRRAGSRLHQIEMALSAAGDAIRAVDLQAYRLRHPDMASGAFDDAGLQRQTDARFLLVALRSLHRFCGLAVRLTDDADLRDAVATSWQQLGLSRAKDMRDIWEHLDAYIMGKGDLQKPGARYDRPLVQPDAAQGASRTIAGLTIYPTPALDIGEAVVAQG